MMNWMLFAPEIFTLIIAGIFIFFALRPQHAKRDYQFALVLAVIGFFICIASLKQTGTLFNHTYQVDLFSQSFKLIIYAGFLLIICY